MPPQDRRHERGMPPHEHDSRMDPQHRGMHGPPRDPAQPMGPTGRSGRHGENHEYIEGMMARRTETENQRRQYEYYLSKKNYELYKREEHRRR